MIIYAFNVCISYKFGSVKFRNTSLNSLLKSVLSTNNPPLSMHEWTICKYLQS